MKSLHKLLNHSGAAVLLFLILSAFGSAILVSTKIGTDLALVYSLALENLANESRQSAALPTLAVNPVLEKAAQEKANDMIEKGYFAHYAPNGMAPWDWIKEEGYDYNYAGENLAIDFSDSSDVNRAWLNSPTHRDNILNSNYTEIGVAVAEGTFQGRHTTFVVQMFASPKVKAAAPNQIVETSPAIQPIPGQTAEEPVPSDEKVLGLGTKPEVKTPEAKPTPLEAIAINPAGSLRYLYAGIIGVILIIFTSIVIIGVRHHNLLHLLYGTGLITLMLALLTAMNMMFGYVSVL